VALRVKVNAIAAAERRHHQRRPQPIAFVEQDPCERVQNTSISRPEYVM
jgi:hypothetical protein